MKLAKKLGFASLSMAVALGLAGCGDNKTVTLDPKGLEALGDGYVYEGWIIVGGAPLSTGRFNIDSSNPTKQIKFLLDEDQTNDATKFVLTIEPANETGDALLAPSATKILAGDFSGDHADITVNDAAALGTDFASAAGKYILAAPTDDANPARNEAGVWWLDNSGAAPVAGLTLPELPQGWNYEGWAVIDGKPVSTGTFREVNASDSACTFCGPNAAPPFPGEDFLTNAPADLIFPADLRGKTIVISVEPHPDDSEAPFALKPLVKEISSTFTLGGGAGNIGTMNNNAANTNPTARVTR